MTFDLFQLNQNKIFGPYAKLYQHNKYLRKMYSLSYHVFTMLLDFDLC